jgi:hypothetical protein
MSRARPQESTNCYVTCWKQSDPRNTWMCLWNATDNGSGLVESHLGKYRESLDGAKKTIDIGPTIARVLSAQTMRTMTRDIEGDRNRKTRVSSLLRTCKSSANSERRPTLKHRLFALAWCRSEISERGF